MKSTTRILIRKTDSYKIDASQQTVQKIILDANKVARQTVECDIRDGKIYICSLLYLTKVMKVTDEENTSIGTSE